MKKAYAVLLIIAMFMGIVPETKGQAAPFNVKLAEKSVALNIQKSGKQVVYGTSTIQIKKVCGVKIRKVSYRSQNKRIASVSVKGKVKAKAKAKGRSASPCWIREWIMLTTSTWRKRYRSSRVKRG